MILERLAVDYELAVLLLLRFFASQQHLDLLLLRTALLYRLQVGVVVVLSGGWMPVFIGPVGREVVIRLLQCPAIRSQDA